MAPRGTDPEVVVDSDALDEIRGAILTLADRQASLVKAITAQSVRLDAVGDGLNRVSAQGEAVRAMLTEIAEALEGKGEAAKDGNKDLAKVLDAMNRIHGVLVDLQGGTTTLHRGVALLAQRLSVSASDMPRL